MSRCLIGVCQISSKKWPYRNNRIRRSQPQINNEPGCNCIGGTEVCPLGGNCKIEGVIYRADVASLGLTTQTYTGLTSRTFKQRFYGYSHSFNNRDSTTSTTLSSYIWELKDQNRDFNLSWSVVDRGKAFNPVTRRCNLCVKEKFHIIFQPEGASLKKRSELFSTCRHRKRDLLCNLE